MANLGTYVLTNKDYKLLSEITGIAFTSGKMYEMQNLGEDFYIRIGTEGDGFVVKTLEKFMYSTNVDDIYIAPVCPDSVKEKKINIAEFEQA